MLKPAILALIRHILSIAGTALVAKGYQTGDRCAADHRVGSAVHRGKSDVGKLLASVTSTRPELKPSRRFCSLAWLVPRSYGLQCKCQLAPETGQLRDVS